MYQTHENFIPLIWEGDNHTSPNYSSRRSDYGVTGLPSTAFKGDVFDLGGGAAVLGRYQAIYNANIDIPSPMTIDVLMNINGDGQIEVSADFAVTENLDPTLTYRIIYILTNYFSESYNSTVVRHFEEPFTSTNAGDSGNFTYAFDNDSWDLSNIKAVAIVQSVETTGNFTIGTYTFHKYPIVQAGIAGFPISAPNSLPNLEMGYNETVTIDVANLFYYQGNPVDAELSVVSTVPGTVEAILDGTTLTLNTFENFGNTQINIFGTYDGYTGVTSFDVLIIPPVLETIVVDIEDSPAQAAYPNNPTPYENSLTDLGWIEFDVEEEGVLVSLVVDCTWNSIDYASEGSFWLGTPYGDVVPLHSPAANGIEVISFETFDFAGLDLAGTWSLWMQDSYSDGGHQVTDCTVTFNYGAATGHENIDIVAINKLSGNYPNPFNPNTNIKFSTKESGHVTLDVFNSKGQKIKTLVNETMAAHDHTVNWDGTDDNNKSVSSGIYFYKMRTNNFVETKKMLLMK